LAVAGAPVPVRRGSSRVVFAVGACVRGGCGDDRIESRGGTGISPWLSGGRQTLGIRGDDGPLTCRPCWCSSGGGTTPPRIGAPLGGGRRRPRGSGCFSACCVGAGAGSSTKLPGPGFGGTTEGGSSWLLLGPRTFLARAPRSRFRTARPGGPGWSNHDLVELTADRDGGPPARQGENRS